MAKRSLMKLFIGGLVGMALMAIPMVAFAQEQDEAQGSDSVMWQQKAGELAQDAAARIVRKEVTAIKKASKRYAGDSPGFEAWLREFYEGMEDFIIESLHLTAIEAAEYVVLQRDAVLHSGPETLETWKGQQADYLAQRILSEAVSNGTA